MVFYYMFKKLVKFSQISGESGEIYSMHGILN